MEEEILSLKFMKRSVSVEYLIFAILFECNFKWKSLKTKVSYSAGRRDSQRKWFTVSRGWLEVRKAESISLPLPPVQALFPWIAAWGESFQKFLATDPSRLRTRDPFRCGVHQEDYRAPANVWGSCLSDYLAACLFYHSSHRTLAVAICARGSENAKCFLSLTPFSLLKWISAEVAAMWKLVTRRIWSKGRSSR